MKTRLSSFLAAAVLSLAAAPALAVTFGTPDGTAHPYVGTILFERADGYYSCTGTLLSPTVMLTAGHCTEEAGVVNLNTWVSFSPTATIDSDCTTRKCLNRYLDSKASGWIEATAYPHPQYTDFSQFPLTYDVGVLVLESPVYMDTYGELAPVGFLDTVSGNDSFTVVGYGMQGLLNPFYGEEWTRYTGTVKLMELNSTRTGGQSATFTNNPGGGGGTCFGDSGGPVFYQDTNIIVAVVSFGYTPCIGVDYQFRTDLQTTHDFVDDFL